MLASPIPCAVGLLSLLSLGYWICMVTEVAEGIQQRKAKELRFSVADLALETENIG